MTDWNENFWAMEKTWPEDAYGNVFLARALKAVGKTLYPDWNGREPLSPMPLLDPWQEIGGRHYLKSQDTVRQSTLDEMKRLLALHAPDKVAGEESMEAQIQPLQTARNAHSTPPFHKTRKWRFTPQSWHAAVDVVKDENERRQAAIDRLSGAQNFLKTAMRDGKLTYVLQNPKGGAPSMPMPAEWWNTKSVIERFRMCQMSARDPFSKGHAGAGFQHIFVGGPELEVLLKSAIPLSRPKSSEEVESLHLKASAIYNEMLSRDGTPPSRNSFEAACKMQGISTTVARDVHGQKHAQRSRN